MLGIYNKYALGHDIFDIKDDNIIIFPNGNFLTSKVLYNNSTGLYLPLGTGELESNYIEENKEYTENCLDVSNSIVVHDLIKNVDLENGENNE